MMLQQSTKLAQRPAVAGRARAVICRAEVGRRSVAIVQSHWRARARARGREGGVQE